MAASWMSAALIPLEAAAQAMKPAIKAIERRIMSVKLYAGLVEEVEQISEGEPAPLPTPVHLFQRRHYMDEECLARYETGGMEFANLREFDAWLARPANRDRILPHPRCVVAFRVRRHAKEREAVTLRDYFRIMEEYQLDKLTFLYVRNGEQLFRLSTAVDFGEQLFPDEGVFAPGAKLYIRSGRWGFNSGDGSIISEGEYEALVEWDRQFAGKPCYPHTADWLNQAKAPEYELLSPETVNYDDGMAELAARMEQHNRLVLVLQGLLDRSPVLHPHPPWQLWGPDGMGQALRLVYDTSRALVPGEAPDFEAYRSRLNASLKTGSLTVGQELAWTIREAARENARRAQDYRRHENERHLTTFWPEADPGPGRVARVSSWRARSGVAVYEWKRAPKADGWRYGRRDIPQSACRIGCRVSVPARELLNVDAYVPGDYRQFFDDPRTRSLYLQWAPLLLEAEEYHAGNRPPRSGGR